MARNVSANELKKELNEALGPDGDFSDDETIEIHGKGLQSPSFPAGVFLCALIKDLLDIFGYLFTFATLGFLGIIIIPILWSLNIIIWLMLSTWLSGKVGSVKRTLYRRFIYSIIFEFIAGFIPWWTIFVLIAHGKEKETTAKILAVFEKLAL